MKLGMIDSPGLSYHRLDLHTPRSKTRLPTMSVIFRGVIVKKNAKEQEADKNDLRTWRAWNPNSDDIVRRFFFFSVFEYKLTI